MKADLGQPKKRQTDRKEVIAASCSIMERVGGTETLERNGHCSKSPEGWLSTMGLAGLSFVMFK